MPTIEFAYVSLCLEILSTQKQFTSENPIEYWYYYLLLKNTTLHERDSKGCIYQVEVIDLKEKVYDKNDASLL